MQVGFKLEAHVAVAKTFAEAGFDRPAGGVKASLQDFGRRRSTVGASCRAPAPAPRIDAAGRRAAAAAASPPPGW